MGLPRHGRSGAVRDAADGAGLLRVGASSVGRGGCSGRPDGGPPASAIRLSNYRSRRSLSYGAPVPDEPMKNLRPSSKVRSRALALAVRSLLW